MKNCKLGTEGGQMIVDLLKEKDALCQMMWFDLQNNNVGNSVSNELFDLAGARGISVILHGNRVLEEVLNAATHGIGFLGSVVGSVFLGIAVEHKPDYYKLGIAPYCFGICFLFLASTLYHSFNALGPTVNRIFEILDHCGIYMLIAGSYSPFLVILLHDTQWSLWFLAGISALALLGCCISAWYDGPGKVHVENSLCLFMGWAVVSVFDAVTERISEEGLALLFLGGIAYSLGVIFFVKDGNSCNIPDHVIWHIFVLTGSTCHYFCILFHIVMV